MHPLKYYGGNSLGKLRGHFGFIFGSNVLANLLAANFIRMLFTVMAVSLALTMIYLNTGLRLRNIKMPEMTINEVFILLAVGVSGGVISASVGSGIVSCLNSLQNLNPKNITH